MHRLKPSWCLWLAKSGGISSPEWMWILGSRSVWMGREQSSRCGCPPNCQVNEEKEQTGGLSLLLLLYPQNRIGAMLTDSHAPFLWWLVAVICILFALLTGGIMAIHTEITVAVQQRGAECQSLGFGGSLGTRGVITVLVLHQLPSDCRRVHDPPCECPPVPP